MTDEPVIVENRKFVDKGKVLDIKFDLKKKYPIADVQKLYEKLDLMTYDKYYPFQYIPDLFKMSYQNLIISKSAT